MRDDLLASITVKMGCEDQASPPQQGAFCVSECARYLHSGFRLMEDCEPWAPVSSGEWDQP